MLNQAGSRVSESAPQLRIGERARSSQLAIEPIDLSLFFAQFLVFGHELPFHVIQPPAQRGDHLVLRLVTKGNGRDGHRCGAAERPRLRSLRLCSAIRPQSVHGWHRGPDGRRQVAPPRRLWPVTGQERTNAAVVALLERWDRPRLRYHRP